MKWFNVKPLASAVLARPILSRLSLSFSLEWGMQLPYQGLFFTSEWVRRIRMFPVVFHDKTFQCQKCCHFIYLLKEHGGHIHHFSFPASQRKELLFDHMWSHLHSGSFSSLCHVIDNGFRRNTGSTQSPWVGREEIKEQKEWLVYFCLLLSYFPRPDRENRYLQVLRNTVGLNSYLGLFALCNRPFPSSLVPLF